MNINTDIMIAEIDEALDKIRKKELEEKDKEIERLNNIIKGQQIEIKKSWKEINKYKNIIEEYEKWLKERLEKLDMNGFDDDIYNGFEYSLDKLKTLKEGK